MGTGEAQTSPSAPMMTSQCDEAIYQQLRETASRLLHRSSGSAEIEPTTIVHEAWLRMTGQRRRAFENANHFKAIASTMMHRVLVDHLRRKTTERDALTVRVPIDPNPSHRTTLHDLSRAMQQLHAIDRLQYDIVCQRILSGLTMPEIAEGLGRPLRTIEREWSMAKAWLLKRLTDEDAGHE